jgi:hypothetical protein
MKAIVGYIDRATGCYADAKKTEEDRKLHLGGTPCRLKS